MGITYATQGATLSLQLRKRTLVKSMIQINIQLEIQDSVLILTMIARSVENLKVSRFVFLLLGDIVEERCV